MTALTGRSGRTLVFDRAYPVPATILIKGWDLTAAPLHAQVRLYPDSVGLLLDLPRVTDPAAQGVRLIGVVPGTDGRPWSTVAIQPTRAGTLALPAASDSAAPLAEIGDNALFTWGLVVTPPADVAQYAASGDLIIVGGAVA